MRRRTRGWLATGDPSLGALAADACRGSEPDVRDDGERARVRRPGRDNQGPQGPFGRADTKGRHDSLVHGPVPSVRGRPERSALLIRGSRRSQSPGTTTNIASATTTARLMLLAKDHRPVGSSQSQHVPYQRSSPRDATRYGGSSIAAPAMRGAGCAQRRRKTLQRAPCTGGDPVSRDGVEPLQGAGFVRSQPMGRCSQPPVARDSVSYTHLTLPTICSV